MFKFLLLFMSLSFSSILFAQDLDKYGGFTHIKGEKTGYFHTEKIDGRWWLVTPEGNAFWGIGMAHPVTAWNRGTIDMLFKGNQDAWLRSTIKRMKGLGYNCVWSGPYSPERCVKGIVDQKLAREIFRENLIPYVFPLPLVKHNVELAPGEKQPDVFSEEYIQHVNSMIDEFVPLIKNDPWVMGYYYGFGGFDRDTKWVNDTLSRFGSPGRKQLVSVLEKKYSGNINELNQVHGKSFQSFKTLKESGNFTVPDWTRKVKFGTPMPNGSKSQKIFEDTQLLLSEIITQVYRLGHERIRKHDKNHLIFGNYVKEATLTTEMWKRVDPYIDVISPQHISKVFPIDKISKLLNKPAFMSDQPLGNVYPDELLCAQRAHGPVPGHLDRLVLYNIIASRVSKDRHLLGINICACLFDQTHPDKAYEVGQPGFFSRYGNAKEHLCRAACELNKEILGNVTTPAEDETVKVFDLKFHETKKRLRQVIDDRKALLRKIPAVVNP